ncbi:hypothetical protein A5893_10380 [Pedobacter psychrophilus]|uniref:TonB-dependent receptor-like beta-barrel domain-containing protein n=1 Tax=Pedobacter psychrophilus TaxID=1826909 RepID=A0A179DF22_9SPHI|nr:hypothetical protein A5893_10380 [Pedobacter psychrophilus]
MPEANRKGYFPGVSVAYRISEESFFKNSTALGFISDFRIRGSFAEVGNIAIGRFRYLGQYSAAVYGGQSGIGFSNIGNPALRWEEQKKYDLGLELGFLDGRINFIADYFRQDNDKIVLSAPTAPSLGVPGNSIVQNVGNIRNSGFELGINAEVLRKGDFTWSSSFNFTTQKNKVLALFNNEDQIGAYNIIRVGESINALYGYQYLGVAPANGNPLYQKANGTIIQGRISNQAYYTYDPANPNQYYNSALPISASNPDNRATLASSDRSVLGSVLPKWFGGFNNTFTYKGIDLNVLLRYQGGNLIYNRTRTDLVNQNFVNNGTEILGRWKSVAEPGDGVTPSVYFGRSTFINLDNQAYTRFVEKGDFLRLDNLSLGYKIPSKALNKISVGSVRIYASAQNLFVITGYKGLDPETNTNGAGVDYNGNPQQRTFTFGINLGI